MLWELTSMKTNYSTISPFRIDGNTNIDGNTHTPILMLPLWPSLLIKFSLDVSLSFWNQCKRVSLLGTSPLSSCLCSFSSHVSLLMFLSKFIFSLLSIKKSDSPWRYNFSKQYFFVFMLLTLSLLIFIFISLWHHG